MPELKICRKCGKERNVQNKTLGWCRGCLLEFHKKFNRKKILPHPSKYEPIMERVKLGYNQKEIANDLGLSRQTVQRVVSAYTVKIDSKGREWRYGNNTKRECEFCKWYEEEKGTLKWRLIPAKHCLLCGAKLYYKDNNEYEIEIEKLSP